MLSYQKRRPWSIRAAPPVATSGDDGVTGREVSGERWSEKRRQSSLISVGDQPGRSAETGGRREGCFSLLPDFVDRHAGRQFCQPQSGAINPEDAEVGD